MDRYVLREGSRGGERILGDGDDPRELLRHRDQLRKGAISHNFVFDVIDTEATDPPESGIIERCPGCGQPTLASRLEI